MNEVMTPAEVLAAAADKLDALVDAANPGPWFYNSYSAVFSQPMLWPYEEFSPEDGGHSLERANNGTCEVCGDWREPLRYPDGTIHWTWPRGHGCKFYDDEYDKEPVVAHVPSHHGDTAIRHRKADAEYIAAMNPLVGKALAEWLRAEGAMAAELVQQDGFTSGHALALARLIIGGES